MTDINKKAIFQVCSGQNLEKTMTALFKRPPRERVEIYDEANTVEEPACTNETMKELHKLITKTKQEAAEYGDREEV